MREWQFGRIDRGTPFDVAVIDERFPHRDVRTEAEPELAGATIQLLDGDEVLAHVFPSEEGTFVGRVWSTHRRARGPGGARVGRALGTLGSWSSLRCAPAARPLDDHLRCSRPGARVGYAVRAPAGARTRDELRTAGIVGILWNAE